MVGQVYTKKMMKMLHRSRCSKNLLFKLEKREFATESRTLGKKVPQALRGCHWPYICMESLLVTMGEENCFKQIKEDVQHHVLSVLMVLRRFLS